MLARYGAIPVSSQAARTANAARPSASAPMTGPCRVNFSSTADRFAASHGDDLGHDLHRFPVVEVTVARAGTVPVS